MPIANNFSSIHSETYQIAFTQCSPTAYLKYTELCNLLQLTAAAHADIGGISFTDMQASNQAWVMSRMRIEINALPKWRDIVTIKTWIVSLENSRSVRALEVFCNNKKIVGCETFWAVINTKIRRPEKLNINHDHFEKFPTTFSTQQRVGKISVPDNMTKIGLHKVVLSDLDIVNHVNNVKYLEWCLDYENPEQIVRNQISSLEMNFMREFLYQDTAEILNYTDSNASVYSVEKENKSSFLLEIKYK